MPPRTEVAVFAERVRKYGAIGASIVREPLALLQLADGEPEGPSEEPFDLSAFTPGQPLERPQILAVLRETVRVQGIVQLEVSALARKLAKSERKKQKKPMTFMDAHKRILELELPREPLEDLGLTESSLQQMLLQYEGDEEVMAAAQKLLHPMGKVDPEKAKGITMEKVVDIHQFMVLEMQKVLQEFLQLPRETRQSLSAKAVETTAELMVSIAVEQQLSVHCEDVEQAVIKYEELLQGHPEFARCTEQLANMMQHLIGAAQPRVEKEDFLRVLRVMGESLKEAKAFAKKLYEDYRAKSCNVGEAYRRFSEFSEAPQRQAEAEGLPDLSSVELQLAYYEYREDPEVRQLWERSGAESSMVMQMMTAAGPKASGQSPSSSEEKKGKKLKSGDVVEMQELMVDELKRTTEAAVLFARKGGWKAETAVQMVQALASAAVERRFGTSAEEMTIAGFQHATALQRNERFVRATGEQQEVLVSLATACGQSS